MRFSKWKNDKSGGKLTVVEQAELRRRNQARQDFGDEASLMLFEHADPGGRLSGKLQLAGDPSGLKML